MILSDTLDVAAKQVIRLFEDILATLPPGCATLEWRVTKMFPNIAVMPTNVKSAEFGVLVNEPSLYGISFGRGKLTSQFECPWEIGLKRSDSLDRQLSVLERMSRAVIAGRCEHLLAHISIRGTIYVSEKEIYRISDLPKLPPRWRKQIIRYEPYYPTPKNHQSPLWV